MTKFSKRRFILTINKGWISSDDKTSEAKLGVYERARRSYLDRNPGTSESKMKFIANVVGGLPVEPRSPSGLRNAKMTRLLAMILSVFLLLNVLALPELPGPIGLKIGMAAVVLAFSATLFSFGRRCVTDPFGSNFDTIFFVGAMILSQMPKLIVSATSLPGANATVVLFPILLGAVILGMIVSARRARVRLCSNTNILGTPYKDKGGNWIFFTREELLHKSLSDPRMIFGPTSRGMGSNIK
jgi:hypothetical protein